MYQLLDEHFIGLIFSVFNSDAASKAGRVQVTRRWWQLFEFHKALLCPLPAKREAIFIVPAA